MIAARTLSRYRIQQKKQAYKRRAMPIWMWISTFHVYVAGTYPLLLATTTACQLNLTPRLLRHSRQHILPLFARLPATFAARQVLEVYMLQDAHEFAVGSAARLHLGVRVGAGG
jgi:hypothetical protein